MEAEFPLIVPIEVRWSDLDAMGHVNNAVYFTYCESARMRYFEEIQMLAHAEGPRHGPALVSAALQFRRQLHYPATIEVAVRTVAVERRSFRMEYRLSERGSSQPVAEGDSAVAWIDYQEGRAIPIPATLRSAIERLEGRALLPTSRP